MQHIQRGTKTEYDGVLFTTEEYKNYKKLSKTIQEVLQRIGEYETEKYV